MQASPTATPLPANLNITERRAGKKRKIWEQVRAHPTLHTFRNAALLVFVERRAERSKDFTLPIANQPFIVACSWGVEINEAYPYQGVFH